MEYIFVLLIDHVPNFVGYEIVIDMYNVKSGTVCICIDYIHALCHAKHPPISHVSVWLKTDYCIASTPGVDRLLFIF